MVGVLIDFNVSPNPEKNIKDIGKDIIEKIKTTHNKFQQAHKELNSQFTKFGKSIDHCFVNDHEKLLSDKVKFSESTINKIIAEHLIRDGHENISEIFEKECGVTVSEEFKTGFKDLCRISESLKQRQVGPALEWTNQQIELAQKAKKEQKEIDDLQSLAFQLHRLNFIQLLIQNEPTKAVQYAKKHLQSFADKNLQDIRYMMGGLAYCGRDRLAKSERYNPLLNVSQWDTVLTMFKRLSCRRINQPVESPLYVSINAGYQAIPTLLKMASVMEGCKNMTGGDHMKVEIDLDDDYQFHSIFSCPISKEHPSETNPPMLLPCHHVLLDSSLNRLARTSKFKCPYCPTQGNISDCKPLNL